MIDQRELDRMLGAFFNEGPDELADRVIDAALDEIDQTQQRRAVRLPRGYRAMSMLTRLAAAAAIGVLAVGGALYLARPGQPGVGGPGPTPGASAGPGQPASPSPGPVVPGKAAYVAGTETVTVTTPGTPTQAGDATRLRGRVVASVDTMDDPRVSGTGTITANFDMYGRVGPQWGTYRLENAGGAWEGKWTGALWEGGNATNVAGWLVGSGAYQGWTYFTHVWGTTNLQVEGVIYPGSPPTTAPLPSSSPIPASASPAAGAGPAYVTGTGTFSLTGGTQTLVGDVWQYRDAAIASYATLSDPRVSGKGSSRLDYDLYGTVGREWGTFEVGSAGGAWTGTYAGALWDQDSAHNRSDGTFWSVGSGAYAGYTYYQDLRATADSVTVEGIIFPGPPPTP
jgi:hypothetical protein